MISFKRLAIYSYAVLCLVFVLLVPLLLFPLLITFSDAQPLSRLRRLS